MEARDSALPWGPAGPNTPPEGGYGLMRSARDPMIPMGEDYRVAGNSIHWHVRHRPTPTPPGTSIWTQSRGGRCPRVKCICQAALPLCQCLSLGYRGPIRGPATMLCQCLSRGVWRTDLGAGPSAGEEHRRRARGGGRSTACHRDQGARGGIASGYRQKRGLPRSSAHAQRHGGAVFRPRAAWRCALQACRGGERQ